MSHPVFFSRALWIGLLILAALVGTDVEVGGWNDSSRMASVQTLVEHGTLAIDASVFTPYMHDKVFIGGRYFSDKPATPALLGAVIYWPLYHLLDVQLKPGLSLAYYLVTLLTVKALWVASGIAFFKCLGLTGLSDRARLWCTGGLIFASLHLSWSSAFNNHSQAASTLIIGFYFLLRARHEQPTRARILLAGAFLALAGACDLPTALFFSAFLVYVLAHRSLRPYTVWFLLPTLLVVGPGLLINYAISGGLLPVQLDPAHFNYPGSPWLENGELSGVAMNHDWFLLEYTYRMLLDRRGFLLYNPMLWIALPLLIRAALRRGRFTAEAWVIGVSSLVIVSYYLLTTHNYGGRCFSIRWFVPLLPLLLFFLHPFLARPRPWQTALFALLFVLGTLIALDGVQSTWLHGRTYDLIDSLMLLI
jgi:hypothetical protein